MAVDSGGFAETRVAGEQRAVDLLGKRDVTDRDGQPSTPAPRRTRQPAIPDAGGDFRTSFSDGPLRRRCPGAGVLSCALGGSR